MAIANGQVLTAEDFLPYGNQTWQNYTPALTAVTLGTGGSITGAWHYVAGGEISGYLRLVLGTGGVFTGSPTFGLPMAIVGGLSAVGSCRDDSTTARRGLIGTVSSSTAFSLLDSSTGAFVNATLPWTWAANDSIDIAFGARV